MTAYAAIAIAFTTRDLRYCLDSTHLTFRHLVKLSRYLVTQNHPLTTTPQKKQELLKADSLNCLLEVPLYPH